MAGQAVQPDEQVLVVGRCSRWHRPGRQGAMVCEQAWQQLGIGFDPFEAALAWPTHHRLPDEVVHEVPSDRSVCAIAAAKARCSTASAYWIEADPRLPSEGAPGVPHV